MDIFATVFVLSLLVFFFTHCWYFFNLNWESRSVVNFVNLLTLWLYLAYLGYLFLSLRTGLFMSRDQNLILLGGVLLLVFTLTDFFSGTRSLGLIFSALVLLLGTTGLVNVHFNETVEILSTSDPARYLNFFLFLDQLGILLFFIAILLSILYHYSFIEIKYHRRFFFSNRFPGFDRLWHQIDRYLLGGLVCASLSLFLYLEFDEKLAMGDLYGKMIGGITVVYYLALLYIRYRKWFSSKLNLYWMLLSLAFLLIKVGYWA